MVQIDVRGKSCPYPVIMAKKEYEKGTETFSVLVDNKTAVENLMGFGSRYEMITSTQEKGADFEVAFFRSQDSVRGEPFPVPNQEKKTFAVFVGNDMIGEGAQELGETLLRMYFFTLAQEKIVPSAILFMNNGVKVPSSKGEVVDHLRSLQEMGTEILVCGACLNSYGLIDHLKVGKISNMMDIAGAMHRADKVITL